MTPLEIASASLEKVEDGLAAAGVLPYSPDKGEKWGIPFETLGVSHERSEATLGEVLGALQQETCKRTASSYLQFLYPSLGGRRALEIVDLLYNGGLMKILRLAYASAYLHAPFSHSIPSFQGLTIESAAREAREYLEEFLSEYVLPVY